MENTNSFWINKPVIVDKVQAQFNEKDLKQILTNDQLLEKINNEIK